MHKCPCCYNDKLIIRRIFNQLPVSSAALHPQPVYGKNWAIFDAAVCENCKHITNINTSRCTTGYSDSSYFLKTAVTDKMSENLMRIIKFILPNEDKNINVLEVGSGAGEIARWLDNAGVDVYTVDPSISHYKNTSICHYNCNFDNNFVMNLDKKFDIIICRHVVEHTEDPGLFLSQCLSLLKDHGKLYVEVPNLINTLETDRYVDFFNDHIHHFSKNSLCLISNNNGLSLEDYAYWLGEAHMGLMFVKGKNNSYINSPSNIGIGQALDRSLQKFNHVINTLDRYDNIAIYGAGAHACTFVSQIPKKYKNKIKRVFDRSSSKLGRYIQDLEIAITYPTEELIKDQQLIINTSSLYKTEVQEFLTDTLKWSGIILHL